ncbi:MAG: G/U mismatch-specific uracil DNA glycosylase [uncultured Solirubrobacteraceae bacterium]|uniref:G/U mismatch-specific uracil DNA glycosylase n=1 Tax=uncultured Solirubrobacteraceae bacterium TaxID=1162706 RepID=A0A6J4TDZ2_9ACTN|nr:MAG: G/U mismatch-specific uracil DNA glycosylase [uncultured Solirubrobacteraceae bacterium]
MSRHAGPAPHSASAKPLADLGGPGLRLLLCGINPSLRSAEAGHHFARPGNRFWPALHLAGITPRRLAPAEQHELLPLGVGITNVCARPTRRADELTPGELLAGALALEALVAGWRPGVVAIVGVTAYRAAFTRPRAVLGEQAERLGGRPLWVLPNPSGLNAHHRVEDLAGWYGAAWAAVGPAVRDV